MSRENPEIQKTETEVWKSTVGFGRALAYTWEPGKEYAVDAVIRPRSPGRFEHKCTVAGETSDREPTWKKAAGQVTKDGDAEWTAQKVSTAGRDAIQSINIDSPSGINTTAGSFSGTEVTFDVSGGTYDATGEADPYEISVEVTTVAGEVIEKKVYVEITGT